jgi:hypothetical protein
MSIEIIDLINKDDIAIHLPSSAATRKNVLPVFSYLRQAATGDGAGSAELFSRCGRSDHLRLWKAGVFLTM